jgi:hypothetical protein
MQYRSQSGAEQPRKLARRLLHKMREAHFAAARFGEKRGSAWPVAGVEA